MYNIYEIDMNFISILQDFYEQKTVAIMERLFLTPSVKLKPLQSYAFNLN